MREFWHMNFVTTPHAKRSTLLRTWF